MPAVFQALVNDVLGDMPNCSVFVYLDDILFFSPVDETHVQHVKQVLQRLLDKQLYVKAEMWGSFVFSHVLGIYCG